MSTFVLVHGAWHGGWCWFKVTERLERAGHRVVAPDLPSLGIDTTDPNDITLDVWSEHLGRVLDAEDEKVVLVGHSLGGAVISDAAERHPDKIDRLVYVAAFLLQDGESQLTVAQADGSSRALAHLEMAADERTCMIKREAFREVYYNTCSDEDISLARTLLKPQPVAPMITPIHTTDDRFGQIPRVYIECLQDNAIPIGLQQKMYTDLPCEEIITLDVDHSPFLCAADDVTSALLKYV